MKKLLNYVDFIRENFNGVDYDESRPNLHYEIYIDSNLSTKEISKKLPKEFMVSTMEGNVITGMIQKKGTTDKQPNNILNLIKNITGVIKIMSIETDDDMKYFQNTQDI
jgi:hypothetical protein